MVTTDLKIDDVMQERLKILKEIDIKYHLSEQDYGKLYEITVAPFFKSN